MSNKNRVFTGSLALFAFVSFSTVDLRAGEAPGVSENSRPSEAADQYRLKAQRTLRSELKEAQAEDEDWHNLPPAYQEKYLQAIKEKAKNESDAMIEEALIAEKTAIPTDDCPFRGLLYPDREPAVPVPFHGWQLTVLNYWGGALDGVCTGVFAGYDPTNPLQGQLAVFTDPNHPEHYEVFPTPTASGPVHIVTETEGVLIVSSLRGKFNRNIDFVSATNTVSHTIDAPGGTIYVFDLHALRYVER
jgi:hypothetical protein